MRLKQHLQTTLTDIIPKDKPVIYFDYAVYPNVGDLLIHQATERFLVDNEYQVLDAYSTQNYKACLAKTLPKDATLVFQGGGNFGDLFSSHEKLRLSVLNQFPKHKAVILPQTIFYKSAQKRAERFEQYNQHPDLTICTRDESSVEIASKHSNADLVLLPDIAHYLQETVGLEPAGLQNSDQASDLFFVRALGADNSGVRRAYPLDLPTTDLWNWPRFLTPVDKACIKAIARLLRMDEHMFHSSLPLALWNRYRDRLLRRAFCFFNQHATVYTNRLHGCLFGLLCGRPIVMFDTGYGKLQNYYDTWLTNNSRVQFIVD